MNTRANRGPWPRGGSVGQIKGHSEITDIIYFHSLWPGVTRTRALTHTDGGLDMWPMWTVAVPDRTLSGAERLWRCPQGDTRFEHHIHVQSATMYCCEVLTRVTVMCCCDLPRGSRTPRLKHTGPQHYTRRPNHTLLKSLRMKTPRE